MKKKIVSVFLSLVFLVSLSAVCFAMEPPLKRLSLKDFAWLYHLREKALQNDPDTQEFLAANTDCNWIWDGVTELRTMIEAALPLYVPVDPDGNVFQEDARPTFDGYSGIVSGFILFSGGRCYFSADSRKKIGYYSLGEDDQLEKVYRTGIENGSVVVYHVVRTISPTRITEQYCAEVILFSEHAMFLEFSNEEMPAEEDLSQLKFKTVGQLMNEAVIAERTAATAQEQAEEKTPLWFWFALGGGILILGGEGAAIAVLLHRRRKAKKSA